MLKFYQVIAQALEGVKPRGPKLSQRGLCRQLGCAQRTICNYLSGKVLPPATRLPDYAITLGYPLAALQRIVDADLTLPRRHLVRHAAAYHRRQASATAAVATATAAP